MVLVQMFQHGQTGLGVLCVVLFLCFGIGFLIVFIYGWVKSGQWNIQTLMLVWTGLVVLGFILEIVALATGVALFKGLPGLGA
jgi:hypothetical protein